MVWIICMYLSYVILLLLTGMIIWSFFSKKKNARLSQILFLGVSLASVTMFFPCYKEIFHTVFFQSVKAILACIHHTMRLFIIDGELTFVTDMVMSDAPKEIISPYIVLATIIFIVSPLFTFGFILSLFKNASARNHFLLARRKDKYIFSTVNDSTVNLAEDIRRKYPKAFIAFMDADEKALEASFDYFSRLRAIRAICFSKNIANINIAYGSSHSKTYVFLFSLDEDENHRQAMLLYKKYHASSNISIYVHSVLTDSDLLLNPNNDNESSTGEGLRVRRINDVRLLIYNILYQQGHRIFDSAVASGDGDKTISAVIVGMGNHGTEMLRALPSFCQMDGYKVYITAIDISSDAQSKFSSQSPELMDDKHNGDFETIGEAHYDIRFLNGMDVRMLEFEKAINNIPSVTFVFISLGNDSLNITTAKTIRRICSLRGEHPLIQAIVYDTEKTEILKRNKSDKRYDIDFVGDIKSFYTEEVIMASEVEKLALQRHLHWGVESDFWASDYMYRSSVASVLHRKMKEHCGIPQINLSPNERGESEKLAIRILEHRRWNAYMRAEGYIFGAEKNHLLKTHCDLVPFFDLSPESQAKDDD